MRSGYPLPMDFSIFILAALVLSLFIRISPLSADSVPQPEGITQEEAEIIASLEFLGEEAALVDDYEALDQWEGEHNEQ